MLGGRAKAPALGSVFPLLFPCTCAVPGAQRAVRLCVFAQRTARSEAETRAGQCRREVGARTPDLTKPGFYVESPLLSHWKGEVAR